MFCQTRGENLPPPGNILSHNPILLQYDSNTGWVMLWAHSLSLSLSLSLSSTLSPLSLSAIHSNSMFPGEPELSSYIAAKDDGSGGDKWSYKTCKAPVKSSSPPTNQHPTFYRSDSLPVRCQTNSVKALKGKYHTPRTCIPQSSPGFLQLCL